MALNQQDITVTYQQYGQALSNALLSKTNHNAGMSVYHSLYAQQNPQPAQQSVQAAVEFLVYLQLTNHNVAVETLIDTAATKVSEWGVASLMQTAPELAGQCPANVLNALAAADAESADVYYAIINWGMQPGTVITPAGNYPPGVIAHAQQAQAYQPQQMQFQTRMQAAQSGDVVGVTTGVPTPAPLTTTPTGSFNTPAAVAPLKAETFCQVSVGLHAELVDAVVLSDWELLNEGVPTPQPVSISHYAVVAFEHGSASINLLYLTKEEYMIADQANHDYTLQVEALTPHNFVSVSHLETIKAQEVPDAPPAVVTALNCAPGRSSVLLAREYLAEEANSNVDAVFVRSSQVDTVRCHIPVDWTAGEVDELLNSLKRCRSLPGVVDMVSNIRQLAGLYEYVNSRLGKLAYVLLSRCLGRDDMRIEDFEEGAVDVLSILTENSYALAASGWNKYLMTYLESAFTSVTLTLDPLDDEVVEEDANTDWSALEVLKEEAGAGPLNATFTNTVAVETVVGRLSVSELLVAELDDGYEWSNVCRYQSKLHSTLNAVAKQSRLMADVSYVTSDNKIFGVCRSLLLDSTYTTNGYMDYVQR